MNWAISSWHRASRSTSTTTPRLTTTRGIAIDTGRLAAGVLERVHLAVEDRAAFRDPAVVAAPENPPAVDETRRG
jgi:hypothetical protein